jgi:hypothetical protein
MAGRHGIGTILIKCSYDERYVAYILNQNRQFAVDGGRSERFVSEVFAKPSAPGALAGIQLHIL